MAYPAQKPHELHPSLTRVLCISAHPDDNEFGIAGTVARWAREGRTVVFCLVTSGSAGTNEHTPHNDGLVPLRERECWDAATLLGVKEIVFLRYQDGVVEPTLGLRRDLTRVIRQCKPDVVICGDPTVRWFGHGYLNHPDHRAAASAALDAIFPSSETRYIFPELLAEGLEPHKVKEVYINFGNPPDTWVDIGDTLDLKCAALKAHRSQLGPGEWIDKEMREWAEREGEGTGIKYSEAYRRMVFWDEKTAESLDQKTGETDAVTDLVQENVTH
jgi:LmbE family N-acetylglucosaminyl deacetylase